MARGVLMGTCGEGNVGSKVIQNLAVSIGEGDVSQSKLTSSLSVIIVQTEAVPLGIVGNSILEAELNPTIGGFGDSNVGAVNCEIGAGERIDLVVTRNGDSLASSDIICILQHQASLVDTFGGGEGDGALGGVLCCACGQAAQHGDHGDHKSQSGQQGDAALSK